MARKSIEFIVRGVWLRSGSVLVCRSCEQGNAFLPGGHVEWGESAKSSLKRELREEIGCSVRVGAFLGACEASFRQKGVRHQEVNLVFMVHGADASRDWTLASREEHIEFLWVPLREIRKQDGKAKTQPADGGGIRLLPDGMVQLVRQAAAMAGRSRGCEIGWVSAWS